MANLFSVLLSACLLFFSAYSTKTNDQPVGADRHSLGLYSFEKVNDFSVAVDQMNNEKGQHIGYDIYMDGESLGDLLCEIRCTDGGYTPDEIDRSDYILIEDYNGDGLDDIGAPLKNGDVMWYLQAKDVNGNIIFRR